MKLKCIKNERYLTLGKYYRLRDSKKSPDQYWVYEDDLNQGGWYFKKSFQTIEDNRNDIVDQILK